MARTRKEIEAIVEQIERLPREDQVALLERVLTPSLRLRLLLDRWHARTRRHDPRAIIRTVNRVAREVRCGREAAGSP